jgi:hypothetical protein
MIYYFNNSAADNRTVPCIENTATDVPMCVRVDIEYSFGTNVTIEIEGVDVRVSIDGIREAMRCTSPSFNAIASINVSNGTSDGTVMSEVEEYYQLSVETAPSMTFHERLTLVSERARHELRTPMTMVMPQLNAANVTLYPKSSLACCTARFLRSAGRFVVSLAFEIIYTVRSLLSLPAAIPGYVFEVPTFRTAVDELRDAVCELACAITRIIPAEYRCQFLTVDVGCSSGPTCAQGLLCHLADAVLLMVEILVEILETIRELVDEDGDVPTSSPVLGSDCSINNVGNCISSVIVYVIVKVRSLSPLPSRMLIPHP